MSVGELTHDMRLYKGEWVFYTYYKGNKIGYCDVIPHTSDSAKKYFNLGKGSFIDTSLLVHDKLIEISLIKIDKAARKKGVGSSLLKFVCNHFKKHGYGQAFLYAHNDTSVKYEQLLFFYRNLGFMQVQETHFMIKNL